MTSNNQEAGTAIFNGIAERLLVALDTLTAPHIPSPEEARHLDAALNRLIAAFNMRDFELGEEAVWNCAAFMFGGASAGDWEIRLRRTDCDSDTRPKDGDAKQGSTRE